MQLSKAAEIPQELFERIIWHVYRDYNGDKRERMRHLSVLSLISRYWARLFRRELFLHITLRTPDDARYFHEILDTPTLPGLEPIADVTRLVFARPEDKDEPWLHFVFFMFAPKLRYLRSLAVKPLHSGQEPMRSLHPSLPRTLPVPRVSLSRLLLDGLRFPTGRTLSRLLSSIPSLTILKAVHLAFDDDPRPEDFHTTLFPSRVICAARSDDLQLCYSLIPVFIARLHTTQPAARSHGRRRLSSILGEDDLKVLWELMKIFDISAGFWIEKCLAGTL